MLEERVSASDAATKPLPLPKPFLSAPAEKAQRRGVAHPLSVGEEPPADQLRPREVKGTLPEAAFERAGDGTVAMQVAIPFALLRVREVLIRPGVHVVVKLGVSGMAGELPGEEGCDHRLVVRPPELHVVPVFLHGEAADIDKREQAAVCGVPTSGPHPVKDLCAKSREFGIAAAMM